MLSFRTLVTTHMKGQFNIQQCTSGFTLLMAPNYAGAHCQCGTGFKHLLHTVCNEPSNLLSQGARGIHRGIYSTCHCCEQSPHLRHGQLNQSSLSGLKHSDVDTDPTYAGVFNPLLHAAISTVYSTFGCMHKELNSTSSYLKVCHIHSFITRMYCTSSQNNQNSDIDKVSNSSKPGSSDGGEVTDPSLEVMASSTATALKSMKVVPGKGPPPEPPVHCCMSGCANCVWIIYAEELKNYYGDGGEEARKAIEQIENPSLKAFIKLELGFLKS